MMSSSAEEDAAAVLGRRGRGSSRTWSSCRRRCGPAGRRSRPRSIADRDLVDDLLTPVALLEFDRSQRTLHGSRFDDGRRSSRSLILDENLIIGQVESQFVPPGGAALVRRSGRASR
ncbi:MAG: hypothetical protein MZV64_49675 [Ignavibacteriales bacterium]|nr:hypothetical protein [Ignavibacteriales bacterium]